MFSNFQFHENHKRVRKRFRVLACVLILCLALAPVSAAEIYVNGEDGVLPTGIGEAYAIGGSGEISRIAQSPANVISASGIQTVGESLANPYPPPTVGVTSLNVGLLYNTSTVSAVGLSAVVGSGYKFGFYDANLVYYEVGSTAETGITVLKDMNVSLSGGAVGAFHIRLPNTYASYAAALEAAGAYPDAFPAYYAGIYYVLVGQYANTAEANAAAQSRSIAGEGYSASGRAITVVKSGTNRILFEFDYGDTFNFAVRPVANSGKPETLLQKFAGGTDYKYFGDFTFYRLDGNNMTVTNLLSIEDYIRGVVPYEMSSSWPIEALKAQAICARTYAIVNMNKHRAYGFNVCATVDCQAYLGTLRATEHTDLACSSTVGRYVSYQGQLCSTLYSSSNGGASEDSENVFLTALPYCRGKIDPYEAAIEFPNKSWSQQLTAGAIRDKLINRGYSIGTIVAIAPTYTRVGNMSSLTFTDNNGRSVTITKDQCRTVMGLNSINYRISQLQDGSYWVEGGGWGHNVGMSQWGAYSMALVYGKTAEEILKFYYTGVSV